MLASLFDDFERTDVAPAKGADTTYQYLNRSARPAFAVVRKVLDKWFSDFPSEGKESLLSRFQSNRAVSHGGAFFELYCHALLRVQGFSVTLHQSVSGEYQTAPDFLVSREDSKLFYLEATQTLPSKEEQAVTARDARLDDAINALDLPEFYVSKLVITPGKSSPSLQEFKKFVIKCAAELDPENQAECSAARFKYRAGDWEIDIKFIPKPPEARVNPQRRTLGVTMQPASFEQPQTGLKTSLKKKASKYGAFDIPYIVATNCSDDFLEEEDIAAALFGDVEYYFSPGEGITHSQRTRNGFWWGPNGWKNQRVSGVLMVNQLVPWTIGSVSPTLWLNPSANIPLEPSLWKGDKNIPDNESSELRFSEGAKAPDLLETREVSQAIHDEHGSK